MTKFTFLEQLTWWAFCIHGIERELNSKSMYWQSNRIHEAIKQIEFARMSSRDMVRLVELGKKARSEVRWIPHSCENSQELKDFKYEEKDFIKAMKSDIRKVFYEITDYEFHPNVNIDSDFDISEFQFYAKRLQIALYDCDRILGLRLGEFTY